MKLRALRLCATLREGDRKRFWRNPFRHQVLATSWQHYGLRQPNFVRHRDRSSFSPGAPILFVISPGFARTISEPCASLLVLPLDGIPALRLNMGSFEDILTCLASRVPRDLKNCRVSCVDISAGTPLMAKALARRARAATDVTVTILHAMTVARTF